MLARTLITLSAAVLLAVPAGAVSPPVPPGLTSLKPYQIVEQIMVQREVLSLTADQFVRLDAISVAVRAEKHRWVHRGGKPHLTRHVTMISRPQAFAQAMAVLTINQQRLLTSLFQAPATDQRPARRPVRPHGKP